ncbi:hypothetical protein AaE_006043 [Aphanomyces astaci]|uniref:Uncharacterized protein n=1 Tax=Aphanomyces astaci TaxID=112090 RepID=A0A6A5AID0_APHAT|nr:hypothetical protein AaE_006043 [Aphanomyces astaci]
MCPTSMTTSSSGNVMYQALPQLVDAPPAAHAALLTINRREFHLERDQYFDKPVPSRIAMLKQKQRVHQAQNFPGRLSDNSIVWGSDENSA